MENNNHHTAEVVNTIASALQEDDEKVVETISRLVEVLGDELALELLVETQKIENEGGMLTDDEARRRTPGGVFFKLAKNKTDSKQRRTIFGPSWALTKKQKLEPLTWDEIAEFIEDLLGAEQGDASTVKISIVGRPGRIIEKGNVVITSMQNSHPPSLPKGLPNPPSDKTTYVVYIAMKQWSKIKASLKNPEDKLIVEGYPVFDRRIGQKGAMTVYAQHVTTKLVQQKMRESQRSSTGGDKKPAPRRQSG